MHAFRPTTTSLPEMEPFHGQSDEQSDELLGPQIHTLELETVVVGSRLQHPRDLDVVSVKKFLIEFFGQPLLAKHGIQDAERSLHVSTVFPVLGGTAIWFEATLSNLSQQGTDGFLEHVIRKRNGRLRAQSDFVRLDDDFWVQKSTARFYQDLLAYHKQEQAESISDQPASRLNEHGAVGGNEESAEEEYSGDEEDEESRNGALAAQPVGPSAKALGKRPEAPEHPQRPIIPLPRKDLSRSKTQSASKNESQRSAVGAVKSQPAGEGIADDPPFPSIDDDDDDPPLDWTVPVPLNAAGTTQPPPTTGSHDASLQAQPVPPTMIPGPSGGSTAEKPAGYKTEGDPRPAKRQRQLAVAETSRTAPHDDDALVHRPKAVAPMRNTAIASQFQAIPPSSVKREDDTSNVPDSKQEEAPATLLPPSQGAVNIKQQDTLPTVFPPSQAPSSAAPIPRDPRLRKGLQNGPASQVASTSSHPSTATSNTSSGSNVSSAGPNAMLAGFEKIFDDTEKMKACEKARTAHAGLQHGTATGTNDVAGQLAQPPSDLAFPKGPVDPRLRDVKPRPARSETERAEDISRMTRGLAIDHASTSSNSAAIPAVRQAPSASRPDPNAKVEFLMVPRRARASDRPEYAMDVCSPEELGEDTVMATSMDDEMVFVDGLAVLAWEVRLVVLMTGLYLWVRDHDGDIDLDGNYIV